jgi:hypothetical protein
VDFTLSLLNEVATFTALVARAGQELGLSAATPSLPGMLKTIQTYLLALVAIEALTVALAVTILLKRRRR